MNQNCEASAPRKPAPSEGRQTRKLPRSAARSNRPSQTSRSGRLRAEAPGQGRRGADQERAVVEGQDRAAEADRGEGEEGAGRDPEADRPPACRRQAPSAGLQRHEHDAERSRSRSRRPTGRRERVAEHSEAEHGDLDRLGLDHGGHDRERALAHGGEHQGRGEDLGHGPEQRRRRGSAVRARAPPRPWRAGRGRRKRSAKGKP